MGTGYQVYDQHGMYFLTFTIVDWVDIFSRKRYRDIITENLAYCIREKGLMIYSYVIMTNHVHIIMKSATGKLSDTIRDFKKYTSRKLIESIKEEPESRREWMLHRFAWAADHSTTNTNYQVWTHENHAIEIKTIEFFAGKRDYIHMNPVRAGWVQHPEDFVYSSAYAEALLAWAEWV
jgi:REP element-mobilizing transposase RayT